MKTTIWFSAVVMVTALVAFSQKLPVEKDKVFEPPKRPDHKSVISEELSADSQTALLDKLKRIYRDPEVEIRSTKRVIQGFTGSGVVVKKSSELITIDTTPCSNKKELLTFHKEYKESEISEVTCEGKKYPRSKIRQQ